MLVVDFGLRRHTGKPLWQGSGESCTVLKVSISILVVCQSIFRCLKPIHDAVELVCEIVPIVLLAKPDRSDILAISNAAYCVSESDNRSGKPIAEFAQIPDEEWRQRQNGHHSRAVPLTQIAEDGAVVPQCDERHHLEKPEHTGSRYEEMPTNDREPCGAAHLERRYHSSVWFVVSSILTSVALFWSSPLSLRRANDSRSGLHGLSCRVWDAHSISACIFCGVKSLICCANKILPRAVRSHVGHSNAATEVDRASTVADAGSLNQRTHSMCQSDGIGENSLRQQNRKLFASDPVN